MPVNLSSERSFPRKYNCTWFARYSRRNLIGTSKYIFNILSLKIIVTVTQIVFLDILCLF